MPNKEPIQRLMQLGLVVLPLGGAIEEAESFTLFKPESVQGNTRPDWEYTLETEEGEIHCDAPCGTLDLLQGQWVFCVHEYSPNAGPGDFCQGYDCLEQATEAVRHYYFDPDSAMNRQPE